MSVRVGFVVYRKYLCPSKDAVPDYQTVSEQTLYPAISPNDTSKNPAQYAEQLYLQLYGSPINPDALADIACLLTAADGQRASRLSTLVVRLSTRTTKRASCYPSNAPAANTICRKHI